MDGLKPRIPALLEKFERGTASPGEMDELEIWFDSFAGNPDLTDGMTAEQRIQAKAVLLGRINGLIDAAAGPAVVDLPGRQSKRLWPRILVSAMVLAVLTVGGYFLLREQPPQPQALGQLSVDFLAGTNRATLTLADGRVVNLDEAQTGIIIGGEDITYNDGSSLKTVIPSEVEESLPNSGRAPVMLALTTPKGGTYQITLPDGSKVWLNAASTLTYPSRFSGDSREVILEGEAFFDVASIYTRITDAREQIDAEGPRASVMRAPFKVQTNGQTVEVLGTEFNISAYTDNPETKTTLVEGRVRVVGQVGAQTPKGSPQVLLAPDKSSATLSPGEQSIVRGATIEKHQVDVTPYTAWRTGYFHFVDADIRTVLQEFGRWYDLDIVFDGSQTSETFTGRIPRSWSFARVMKLMKPFESTKLTIEGRRVMVSQ